MSAADLPEWARMQIVAAQARDAVRVARSVARVDAARRIEAARRRPTAPVAAVPLDPPPIMDGYATDQPAVWDQPGALTFVLPGRVPLVNVLKHAHWTHQHTAAEDYRRRTIALCAAYRPRPLAAGAPYDLTVRHLVGPRSNGAPLPDCAATSFAVKAALDGMTDGPGDYANPYAVLPDDRHVAEHYELPARGTTDVLYLTLTPAARRPWPTRPEPS